MDATFEGYLDHLDKLDGVLEELTGLAKAKAKAANKGELGTMDQVMRREQALSMSLRSMEQKRQEFVSKLGLGGSVLSALPDKVPEELRPRAKKTSEGLLRRYMLYKDASEVARTTLECNLHMVEKHMGQAVPGTSLADIRA